MDKLTDKEWRRQVTTDEKAIKIDIKTGKNVEKYADIKAVKTGGKIIDKTDDDMFSPFHV
jgi:hypothetical protein